MRFYGGFPEAGAPHPAGDVAIVGRLWAEGPPEQSTGLQPCGYGRRRLSDLKGREKFSHRDQLRPVASRDLSGRNFALILFTGLEPCALFSWAFSPQGMTSFDKTEMAMTPGQSAFSM